MNINEQSVNSIIDSVAEEQKSLSKIIEAESLKIKSAIEMCPDCKELICINKSVESMIDSIINLEVILQGKLKIVLNTKNCNN